MPLDSEEQSLRFGERQSKFRGSAKIKLKHLQFDSSAFVDPKNVTRLTQIFELEGCHRLDVEHHVPAIIKEHLLQSSVALSNITGPDLMKNRVPPDLRLPTEVKLECLHGKHRIAAAQKFLYLPGDKWWTVDLYSDRLSQPLRRDIREDYANSRNFCDGDIFRQIRYCQDNQDDIGAGRWFARLSECKRKDVKQLQRRKELRPLASALDELLPYIGFWPDLQIGTFHRVLNLKCHEELRHYLHHVRDCWSRMLDDIHELKSLVDFRTVQLLQTRNPWASTTDNAIVSDLMHTHVLFPMIIEPEVRSRILSNIQTTDCIIPSLYTFFEDTKWLEPCAKTLRNLLPTNCRLSTHESMLRNYCGENVPDAMVRIQKKNLLFSHQVGSELESVECGYRQLWLFAWRHFPELSAMLPRKDVGIPKPRAKASNEQCWQRFASLAQSLGFKSDNISRLGRQNPDRKMALEFLSQARPDDFYEMSSETRNASAGKICNILRSMQTICTTGESQNTHYLEIPTQHRCGRPYEQSYKQSKFHFFHSDVYAKKTRALTHFAVNRDIFHAFFGSEAYVTSEQAGTTFDMDAVENAQSAATAEASHTESYGDMDAVSGAHGTSEQASTTIDKDAIIEDAQPVRATEASHPDVSPLSEQPEEPHVPQEQETGIETISGRELVPFRDEITTQSITKTIAVADLEQNRNEEGNDSTLQVQIANDTVIDLQRQDVEASYLHTKWQAECKPRYIFAVDLYEYSWECYPRVKEDDPVPPGLLQKATNYSFAVYLPKKGVVKYITVANLCRYAHNSKYDGVVYILKHHTVESEKDRELIKNETIQSITAATTKARLFNVTERCTRKKRFTNSDGREHDAKRIHR